MTEQYPLLCEDLSEEEVPSPRYQRVLMSKARARNHVKGAAAIISRWPGEWTTLLNYWWIGVSMLALTTYILYNSIYIYLAHSYKLHRTPFERPVPYGSLSPHITPSLPFKVFMHIFAEDKKEVNLDNYLPYVDIITNKFKHFQFELIIVANDTSIETKELSDKENNELAMDILWDDNAVNKIVNSNDNLKIKYVTFSRHFHDSPLKQYWKNLPQQLQKFLVRAVSVWQKGGIAFDPLILTPQSPNSNYIEKIYTVLKKYKLKKAKVPKKQYQSTKKIKQLSKSLPNNIRDIINALDEESAVVKNIQEPLVETETKDISTIVYDRNIRSFADINASETNQIELNDIESNTRNEEKLNDNSPKFNLLPRFLEYIFHNKQTKRLDETTTDLKLHKHAESLPKETRNNQASNDTNSRLAKDFWNELVDQNKKRPIIVSAKGIFDKSDNKSKLADDIEKGDESLFEVTIDLKGNVIATDTACHAFIGNMFSDAVYHDESETVTDFIIKELSSFCKGLLASCVGIDVILL